MTSLSNTKTINFLYEIGQSHWIMKDNKPCEIVITSRIYKEYFHADYTTPRCSIKYEIVGQHFEAQVEEMKIHPTKQHLFDSL